MKKFLMIIIALILTITLVGCGQSREADMEAGARTYIEREEQEPMIEEQEPMVSASWVPDTLRFSSLEEFLLSYIAVRDGARAEGFMPASVNGSFEHFSRMAESIDLLSLERFYLPTNIPEEYKLFRIRVTEYNVSLWFLPEEHLGSDLDITNATVFAKHFLFSFTRGLNLENPLVGVMEQSRVTEADLIDGRYYFDGRNLFIWGSNGEMLLLYTPIPPAVGFSEDIGADMVRYAEVYVLDLTDEDAILSILNQEPPQTPID